MSTRFLMGASVVCGGATLAALALLYLRRRLRYPALLAFMVATMLYRGVELSLGLDWRQASVRECVYAALGLLVALDAWGRLANHIRRHTMEAAALSMLGIASVGTFAMLLPGAHPDYRWLIPVSLMAVAALGCVTYAADDQLDVVACWGLTLVFFAQSFHYFGFEFGLQWAELTAWVRTGCYLWASMEIALATRR